MRVSLAPHAPRFPSACARSDDKVHEAPSEHNFLFELLLEKRFANMCAYLVPSMRYVMLPCATCNFHLSASLSACVGSFQEEERADYLHTE